MNSEILKVFRKFVFRERVETYKKLLIFSFFLIVSTTFWLLKTLGKEYDATINYPVKYTNFPKEKVFIGKLPDKFILKVKSTGYQLIKYNLLNNAPIVFNFELFLKRSLQTNSSIKIFYLTKDLKDNISSHLGSQIRVIEILPDTLFFEFADIVNKIVQVKPSIKVKFDKQYTLKDSIRTIPENVYISGINSIVDTINYVKTETKIINNLNHPINFNVPISKIKGVNYSCNEVNIKIDVEKFTESNIEVPIEIINLPPNIKFQIYPEKTILTFFVGWSNFKNIKASDFIVVADYNSIKNNVGPKLKLQILKMPDFIYSIKMKPNFINYSIKK